MLLYRGLFFCLYISSGSMNLIEVYGWFATIPKRFKWLRPWWALAFILLTFCRYSAPIHWLVHGHLTSKDKTVSRQIENYDIKRENSWLLPAKMLAAVACEQSWPDVFTGISVRFSAKIRFCLVLLYNKSLRLGKHWDYWETKFTVLLGTSH